MQKIIISFFFVIIFTTILYSQQKEGDRIIAIVGNEIILESDFQYQVQLWARQNQIPINKVTQVLAQQIFQQMLTDKIIIAKAEQDSILVTEEEINKELDYRVKSLVEQYGTEQRVEQLYGMSIAKIKLNLKEELSKKLKSDKLKRKKFSSGIKVNEREIKEFYETYKDSLPQESDGYELAHIYIIRKVTETEKNLAKQKALQILDSVKKGMDFSELAKKYSDDSLSGTKGGDLGFSKRGVYVKEFEEAVFTLPVGQISDLVETEYGYHIIKILERKGDQTRASHILIAYPKLESSDFETINFLKNLRNEIKSNKISFDTAAAKYSQDINTNTKGGYIGIIAVERLDSVVVEKLKEIQPGDITEPVKIGERMNYGYEILKYISKVSAHKLTLEQDYNKIKRYAEYYKENKEVDKWINELKQTIYIEVKF